MRKVASDYSSAAIKIKAAGNLTADSIPSSTDSDGRNSMPLATGSTAQHRLAAG